MLTNKLKASKWFLLGTVVILLSVLLFFIFRSTPSIGTVIKLEAQPKDTVISSSVLQLHKWYASNGAEVYFVPTEQLPMVDVSVVFPAGAIRDDKKPGVSKIAAHLIGEGTTSLDSSKIAEGFEQLGAIYQAEHNLEYASFHLRSLTDDKKLQTAVNLFTDVLTKPSFPEESIAMLKKQMLIAIAKDKNDPGAVADKNFMSALYGQHPYANYENGDEASIASISKEELQEFYQKFYVKNNVKIVIVGGVHRDTAKEISEKIITNLLSGEKVDLLPPVNISSNDKEIDFSAKQAHVLWGQPALAIKDQAYLPFKIGSYVLGGSMNSRLFKSIRKEQGLSYSVSSYLDGMELPGPFVVSLQTNKEQTKDAVKLMKKVVREFIEEGPSQLELQAAKDYLIGSFPLRFTSNLEISRFVTKMAFYQLADDYLDDYLAKINQLSIEDVNRAFNDNLDLDKMSLVIVK